MTRTVRSRSNYEVGQQVEGCTIMEKRVVIPPHLREHRLGVYDYLVEGLPIPAKPRESQRPSPAPEPASFTRSTPDEMKGRLIRRLPAR